VMFQVVQDQISNSKNGNQHKERNEKGKASW
jgi:hypothetical protein